MTREVIAGDGKVVIVLLKKGSETESGVRPSVHEVACVGRIETYEELEGGKYNIVLAGLHRVRLVREIDHSPYRVAEVAILEEVSCDEMHEEVIHRRNHLGGLFTRYTELVTSDNRRASEMILQLDFEALVNMAATTLNLPPEDRQALLEMDGVTDRCDVLIPILQCQVETLILVRRFEHIKPQEPRWN
jgi:Lon protease-like protein